MTIERLALWTFATALCWQLLASGLYVPYACLRMDADTCRTAWDRATEKIPTALIGMALGILIPRGKV